MCTPLLFLLVGHQAELPTPAAIISKMFKHYAEAHTLQGTIRLVQTAKGKTVGISTVIAVQRPNLVHVEQKTSGLADAKEFALNSDGVRFSYTTPPGLFGAPPMLFESAKPAGRAPLSVGEMYAASSSGMLDRSAPLDIAIARPDDLRFLTGQLASFKLAGQSKLRDAEVYVISGNWRENPTRQVAGTFEMVISKDGDLMRFILKQVIGIGGTGSNSPLNDSTVEVVSTWDSELKIDRPVPTEAFKVRG